MTKVAFNPIKAGNVYAAAQTIKFRQGIGMQKPSGLAERIEKEALNLNKGSHQFVLIWGKIPEKIKKQVTNLTRIISKTKNSAKKEIITNKCIDLLTENGIISKRQPYSIPVKFKWEK